MLFKNGNHLQLDDNKAITNICITKIAVTSHWHRTT